MLALLTHGIIFVIITRLNMQKKLWPLFFLSSLLLSLPAHTLTPKGLYDCSGKVFINNDQITVNFWKDEPASANAQRKGKKTILLPYVVEFTKKNSTFEYELINLFDEMGYQLINYPTQQDRDLEVMVTNDCYYNTSAAESSGLNNKLNCKATLNLRGRHLHKPSEGQIIQTNTFTLSATEYVAPEVSFDPKGEITMSILNLATKAALKKLANQIKDSAISLECRDR